MGNGTECGLVARAVREALGTLVSPQLAAELVARALASAGLSEVPEQGRAIAHFIEGTLLSEIEASVGSDAAELVSAQLAPIVAHASAESAVALPAAASPGAGFGSERPTGVVPSPAHVPVRSGELAHTARVRLTAAQLQQLQRPEEEGYTRRPQPELEKSAGASAKALPRVLAASKEAHAVEALRTYLSGSADVIAIADLVALLDALEEPGLSKPIVLIDCRRPTVHVTSVAAIGEDLPAGTAIVLWGATDGMWRELDRERVPTCRWVRCSHEATTDDVGSLCAMLLG